MERPSQSPIVNAVQEWQDSHAAVFGDMAQTAGRRRQAQHKTAGTAVWRAARQQQVRAAEPRAAARALLAASAGDLVLERRCVLLYRSGWFISLIARERKEALHLHLFSWWL
ncbi:hypothetical protein O3P69_007918 [Scylla paramamosain]|uniref:Uncharacterized protein n=1 Tax=Scylla paramamosain TaxID=85552 RepID=A0AAW0T018_SCYPA